MPRVMLRNFGWFLVMLVGFVLTGCNQIGKPVYDYDTDYADSVFVASHLDAIVNPSFSSVQEVITFQNKLTEEYSIDEVFRSMPEEIIKNVATVCLKKSLSVTKKDIVFEYRANHDVYDNLVTSTTPSTTEQTQSTTTEEWPTPAPNSVSYHYEIDTIDGKPTKVLVKEEKYESK